MLSSLETGILILLKNALNGEKCPLPADFDWIWAYKFGKKHQILPLLYYGGAHIEEFVNSDIGAKFLMATMALASFSENQLYELNAVTDAFEKNKIEYLKLKGSNLKPLYPHAEMRLMSDADILIREEQMPQIEKIVKELGYTYSATSDHEWIWEKQELTLELHKRIIASYQKDFYDYFGNGWQLANKIEGKSEYQMSKEDELVYLFTHLAKHYRDAGVGIKHFVDIYVFLNANKDIDVEYVENTLKKLNLYEFFVNVKNTINVWFSDTEWDEISNFITLKVFESGVYGQKLAALRSEALKARKSNKKQTKFGKYMGLIFPKYENMCYSFPSLKKVPILLPFYWVYRWLRAIFCRRDKIKSSKAKIDNVIGTEEINEYQCELNYVGLDYNF